MAYPGAKYRKQQQQQQPAPAPVPIPVAAVHHVPQQPQYAQATYAAPPRRPPASYQQQPQQPVVATAYAVPVGGSVSPVGAPYAPVNDLPPPSAPDFAPSAPPPPPPPAPSRPPPPPQYQQQMQAAPSNMYAPIGGVTVAPPRPSQQQQQYQQYPSQSSSSSSSSSSMYRPPQQYQQRPPSSSYPSSSYRPSQPQQQPPLSSYPSSSSLPQGTTYQRPGDLHGAQALTSSCAGRSKALFVGITYRGTRSELRGCVNDVKNLHAFIQQFYGFRNEEIRILTDDPSFTQGSPTRNNILGSMQWLVAGAQPGDSLFFHYSGHGGSVRDQNGDEADEMDETILPIDHERAGQIIDDEIHEIMVRPLQKGVRLTAVFDSCHSGSVMDLPFSYKVDGSLQIIQVDNTAVVVSGLANVGLALLTGNKTAALFSGLETMGRMFMGPKNNEAARRRTEQNNQSEADVIQFGGCRDDQTSADAHIDGDFSGALSWAFIKALSASPHQQYSELLQNMRQLLRGKYTQVPQISTSHKIDLFTPFNM